MKKTANKEQRSNHERRQKHIPFYTLFSFKGKRSTLRRSKDCKQITLVDQYHPSLLIYTLIVLGLSLLDAALTLALLNKGAVELNPVMRYYLSLGPRTFVIVKYGLTALSLMIMVVLQTVISLRYRIFSSLMFPSCILLFGSVIIWELYLLTKVSPV